MPRDGCRGSASRLRACSSIRSLARILYSKMRMAGVRCRPCPCFTTGGTCVAEMIHYVDLWGRDIVLYEDIWEDHIIIDHSIMDGYDEHIESVLIEPDVVTRDADHANGVNYYRARALPPPDDKQYLKVCVRFETDRDTGSRYGIIVTTYPTIGVKRSETITWRRKTS